MVSGNTKISKKRKSEPTTTVSEKVEKKNKLTEVGNKNKTKSFIKTPSKDIKESNNLKVSNLKENDVLKKGKTEDKSNKGKTENKSNKGKTEDKSNKGKKGKGKKVEEKTKKVEENEKKNEELSEEIEELDVSDDDSASGDDLETEAELVYLNGFESTDDEDEDNDDLNDNKKKSNKKDKKLNGSRKELKLKKEDEDKIKKAIALKTENKEDEEKEKEKNGKVSKISKGENLDSKNKKEEQRGVVYIGRIPHGFYENQMKEYFGQFGNVTRLRLSRNKKTGASKHYAFVEFDNNEVAKIVADTMNNYLLFGHILKVSVIPPGEVHDELFEGANMKFKPLPQARIAKYLYEKPKTEKQIKVLQLKAKKRAKQKKAQLEKLNIDYDF